MSQETRAKAEEIASRPYRINVRPEETTDGQMMYIADVLEFPGCVSHGPTQKDALASVAGALVDYVESMLEDAMPIPDPIEWLPVSFSSGPLGLGKQTVLTAKSSGEPAPKIPTTSKPEYVLEPV